MANYLYNGVELPALPERDTNLLPYALIELNSLGAYWLRCTDTVATRNTLGNFTYPKPKYIDYLYNPETAGWETDEFRISLDGWWDIYIGNSSTIVWANFDVLNEDGTVHLKASDPVPVGGVSAPIDPTSMLMGWLVGRQIAGMRK